MRIRDYSGNAKTSGETESFDRYQVIINYFVENPKRATNMTNLSRLREIYNSGELSEEQQAMLLKEVFISEPVRDFLFRTARDTQNGAFFADMGLAGGI